MKSDDYRRVVADQKDRVFRYAAYLVRNTEDARDIAQEALLRMWENRQKIASDAAARVWLMRTAHNLAMDKLRQRRARPEAEPEVLDTMQDEAVPIDPQRRVESEELGRRIAEALMHLPERDRSILMLREVEGLSYEQISRIQGLSLGTLKGALHRARARLRERLVVSGVRR